MKKAILFLGLFLVVVTSFSQITTIKKGDILKFEVQNIVSVKFGPVSVPSNGITFILGGPTAWRNKGRPIGGIMYGGEVIKMSSRKRIPSTHPFRYYNSIFGVDVNGMPVMERQEEAFEFLPEMQWAFQNGPALVFRGVVPDLRITPIPNQSQKNYFSGIGFRENGDMIVLVTLRPMTIKKFSFVFREQGCINALLVNSGSGVFYSMNRHVSGARKSFGKSTSRYNFIFF